MKSSLPHSVTVLLFSATFCFATVSGYAQSTTKASPPPGEGIDVLSDTKGVDFTAYLMKMRQTVRENWLRFIPDVARQPALKQGKASIEFMIHKDGKVTDMKFDKSSGDKFLDRAAWASVAASSPFEPLPEEYNGEMILLRLHYHYNPKETPSGHKPD